ncbi:hypothetical protein GYMLUDRAFT_63408 [Collybiopsis luxurians FD-317 M1]|uniref:Metallo-beta-lactamase domain-containing protein n=1 Tax=Collybiopsis luxurians FD-317 M1 TaxID=944289 RepID=A0A0D0CGN5_9AGAR|nr:hypothetical protein GYMLUDRAFT_63408 [Collybiopsis luxurians FD-317 M1]
MSEIILPKSSSTVSVKVFNITSPNSTAPAGRFISPVKSGKERLYIAVYAFLIEHPNGRRMMFDLGLRKDLSGYSPVLQRLLREGKFDMKVEADITEQLKAGGISLEQVDTVIWSHTHFDHIGDTSLFPPTTKLVIGKGSERKAYPEFPDAKLLQSDFAGREVEEIDFEKPDLMISGLPAVDFFGDGSFYLLDTPGHCPGHITALARVKEDSFLLLGGDCCHHPGQLRPNVHIQKNFAYHGDVPTDFSRPILTIPEGPSAYADRSTALASLGKIQLLDAHPDIFLVTAHDATLEGIISLYPEPLNDWKELGWKSKAIWAFMGEGNKGFGYC